MSGIHFKLRSEIAYDKVVFDGHFITVGELKRLIAEKKGFGKDASSDLILSDPRTGEEYKEESTNIPKNTSVLVRRVPGQKQPAHAMPPGVGSRHAVLSSYTTTSTIGGHLPSVTDKDNSYLGTVAGDLDEFGGDTFEEAAAARAAQYQEEENKTLAMVSNTNTAWEHETHSMPQGRGRGRGDGRGRSSWGRHGPGGPGPTYICHRCQQPGHFIKDCPTNADPNFELKRVRMPAGIPMTMLHRSTQGSLLLPSGEVGTLQPRESSFAAEMAALPTVVAEQKNKEAAPSVPALEGPKEEAEAPVLALTDKPHEEMELTTRPVSPPPPKDDGPLAPPAPEVSEPKSNSLPSRRSAGQDLDDYDAGFYGDALKQSVSLGSVDDDELGMPLTSQNSLKLGFGMEETPTKTMPSPPSRSPPRESSPVAKSSYTSQFREALPSLSDIMPRGPIQFLYKAFGYEQVLDPLEFASLQKEWRERAGRRSSGVSGRSRSRSPVNGRTLGGARNGDRDRKGDSKQGTVQSEGPRRDSGGTDRGHSREDSRHRESEDKDRKALNGSRQHRQDASEDDPDTHRDERSGRGTRRHREASTKTEAGPSSSRRDNDRMKSMTSPTKHRSSDEISRRYEEEYVGLTMRWRSSQLLPCFLLHCLCDGAAGFEAMVSGRLSRVC